MIVKKLRTKNDWSQEQLAEYSGLNVRTIQRIESGQRASLESLKCIASVFEVELTTLTEEITVIDKDSATWQELPWWFRVNMCGIRSRRTLLIFELVEFAGALGAILLFQNAYWAATLLLTAYVTGWIVRYGDKKQVW